jgi:hypothetical protein
MKVKKLNENFDKETYQNNMDKKVGNVIKEFVNNNDLPTDITDYEMALIKFSDTLLNGIPIENMIQLIYVLNDQKELISKFIKSIILEYEKENKDRILNSPLYRKTKTKIDELQRIYDMLYKKKVNN